MLFFKFNSGFAFSLLVSITLVACSSGGGAGEQVSGQSLDELQAHYDRLRSEAYQGKTEQASLDEASFIAFARLYLSDEPPAADNKIASSQLSRTAATYLKPLRQLTSEGALAKRQFNLESKPQEGQVNAARIDVDESESCDGGQGRIYYEGYVSDEGLGALAVTFENCLSDGALMNGSGAMYFGERDQGTTLFYDHIRIEDAYGEFYVTGSINNQSGYVSHRSILIQDAISGLTYENPGQRAIVSNIRGYCSLTRIHLFLYTVFHSPIAIY